ncbi:MAG: GxxExxY protein [Chloroflexota bacterium]
MPVEIVEKELSYKIIQAAIEVHKQLGPGYSENLYEEALCIELQHRGHRVERQKKIEVKYKNHTIGLHILDSVVDERVILELKAVSDILPIHLQQALGYLKSTGLPLALVINFGAERVQFHRVVNTKK